MTAPLVLIVPGLGGSGPAHWQSRWEARYPRHVRVQQRDWDAPTLAEWRAALVRTVDDAGERVVLAAHSLGCALVAHAALAIGDRVRAALLVAPADVDLPERTPQATRCFAPLPRAPLPFPSTVVASEDDPFVTLARARDFAAGWRADFIDAGRLGHINAASGLGDWPDGRHVFEALLKRTAGRAPRLPR